MAKVLPFVSLASASSVGAGVARDLEGLCRIFTMVVVPTGTPSLTVALEGSLDGAAWYPLGSAVQVGYELSVMTVSADSSPYARFVRANLKTLSGGSSPSVTATIGIKEE